MCPCKNSLQDMTTILKYKVLLFTLSLYSKFVTIGQFVRTLKPIRKKRQQNRQVNVSFFDPSEIEVLPPAEFDYPTKRKEKETKLNIRLKLRLNIHEEYK